MVVQRSRTLELDGGSRQQASATCGEGSSCKTVPESCRSFQRYRHFCVTATLCPYLQTQGLKERWQQYGTGEKRHRLLLQQAVSQLGAPVVKTVIKAQLLTGDDCMRKVGTKHAAMTCDPVQYLTNFGETDTLSDQYVVLADMYLVRVWARARSTTTAHTFNQLRVEQYTSSRAGIDALPPTSSEIRGHIHRGAFYCQQSMPTACHRQ